MSDRKVAEHPVHRAARLMAEWAIADSGIRIDQAELRAVLADDADLAAYLPDDAQCAEFIMGDDTGAVPAQLAADFPMTHALLEELWA